MMMSTPATNRLTFKMYNHFDAANNGFFTGMTVIQDDGSATVKPSYPGVALMTVNPRTGKKAAEALVQIIPADENVVYSDVVTSGLHGDEITINMNCKNKNSTTPVRFLLGNFSNDKTLFSISDGRNSIIDLVVNPSSYSKLPGTDRGNEVILGDTGLQICSGAQQRARPSTGTCYTIKIGKPRAETKGYLDTFDNTKTMNLHPVQYASLTSKGQLQPAGPTSACSTVRTSGLQTDGCGDSGYDSDEGEVPDCASTSCVSAVTSTNVGARQYSSVDFTSKVTFEVKIFFTKTQYVAPKPVKPPSPPAYPNFTMCGGGKMFFCPHGAHEMGTNPVVAASTMKCPCVDTPTKRDAAMNLLTIMMM